jgi:hypothetical protein
MLLLAVGEPLYVSPLYVIVVIVPVFAGLVPPDDVVFVLL